MTQATIKLGGNAPAGKHADIKKPRILTSLWQHFRPATADGAPPSNSEEEAGQAVYERNPKRFQLRAWKKQGALLKAFREHSRIVNVPANDNVGPDQVFTADSTFTLVIDGHHYTVISKFTNHKRNAEIEAAVAAIKASDAEEGIERTFIQAPYNFEGTGDAVYDVFRDVVWAGYNPNGPSTETSDQGRSDERAHRFLERELDVEFISLPTCYPCYHIDTVMAPLSKGHMLVNVEDMHPDALAELKYNAFERFGLDPDEYLIPLSRKDAKAYASNLRCFGDHIIMPKASRALKKRLEKAGYDVTMIDLKEFLYAGGSGHCLSNNIDEERIRNGLAAIHGFVDAHKKGFDKPDCSIS